MDLLPARPHLPSAHLPQKNALDILAGRSHAPSSHHSQQQQQQQQPQQQPQKNRRAGLRDSFSTDFGFGFGSDDHSLEQPHGKFFDVHYPAGQALGLGLKFRVMEYTIDNAPGEVLMADCAVVSQSYKNKSVKVGDVVVSVNGLSVIYSPTPMEMSHQRSLLDPNLTASSKIARETKGLTFVVRTIVSNANTERVVRYFRPIGGISAIQHLTAGESQKLLFNDDGFEMTGADDRARDETIPV